VNVGGTGVGHEDYMVAEIAGANPSNPVNARTWRSIGAGTTQFSFGGITPSAAGTFPVAFFSAHQGSLTWNSVSSGWTIRDRNTEYSQLLATGPVQTGTATVNATAVLATASKYTGSAEAVLLNPKTGTTTSATPAPTSTPVMTATPVPTAAPTAAPVASGSTYTYHGCVVYGPNDWFTTNLITGGSSYVSNQVDPNSAAMISNLNSQYGGVSFNINGTSTSVMQHPVVNLANDSTPKYTIQNLTYGFANDPYGDDTGKQMPWTSSFSEPSNCSTNDCHTDVLNTQTCVDYEAYNYAQTSWTGSSFRAKAGFVHNLNHPFNNQYAQDAGLITKAGLPYLGMVDEGEDASLPSINHIMLLGIPGSDASSRAAGGYVAPASAGSACAASCTNKIPFGARLRLNPNKYTCPSASSYPQAHKVCAQLETYGAIVTDHNGTSNLITTQLGPTSSGSNPWNQTDLQHLDGIPLSDFDVMKVGTIH